MKVIQAGDLLGNWHEETPEAAGSDRDPGRTRHTLQVRCSYADDHGGWAYTTFVADAPGTFWPAFDGETPEESADWGWFTLAEMKKLSLHPGFKASLPKILAAATEKVTAASITKVGPKGYIHGWVYVGPPDSRGRSIQHPNLGDGYVNGADQKTGTANVKFFGSDSDADDGSYTVDYHKSAVLTPGLYRTSEVPEEPAETLEQAASRLDKVISGQSEESPVFAKKPFNVMASRNPYGTPRGAAIIKYISPSGNDVINGTLRKALPNGVIDDAGVTKTVSLLDKEEAKNTLTKPAVLWRGFAAPRSILGKMTPGQEITDQAYVSTASDPGKAAMFAEMRSYGHAPGVVTTVKPHGGKPVLMKITAPAGTHVFRGQVTLSEWVLPRGSRFKVTSVSADGSVISMDALPPGPVARIMTDDELMDAHDQSLQRNTAAYAHKSEATSSDAERMAWAPGDITFTNTEKSLRRQVELNGQETWQDIPDTVPPAAGGGAMSMPPVPGGVPGFTAGAEPPRWDGSSPQPRVLSVPDDADDADWPEGRARSERPHAAFPSGPQGMDGYWPGGRVDTMQPPVLSPGGTRGVPPSTVGGVSSKASAGIVPEQVYSSEAGDGGKTIGPLASAVEKVGPKGYIHGWVKVIPDDELATMAAQPVDAHDDVYNSMPKLADFTTTNEAKQAVADYTDGSVADGVNRTLRLGAPDENGIPEYKRANAKTAVVIAGMDQAFRDVPPLSHPVTVFRGVSDVREMFGDVGERVGGEFDDKAFTSTSTSPQVADWFARASQQDKAVLTIHVPAGAKAINPDKMGMFGDMAREVVLNRGGRYRVLSDKVVPSQSLGWNSLNSGKFTQADIRHLQLEMVI